MRAFRGHIKNWTIALAVFAIVFQALVPLAQAIPLDRDLGRDSDSPFDSLVICTAWGLKIIKLTTGEEPPIDETTPEKCPVCSVVSLTVAIPVADVSAAPHLFLAREQLLPRANFTAPYLVVIHKSAIRAPPAISA